MFYVKSVSNDCRQITTDNVFCACPECGEDHAVDLVWLIQNSGGDFSLESTDCLCEKCSGQRHAHEKGELDGRVLARGLMPYLKAEVKHINSCMGCSGGCKGER